MGDPAFDLANFAVNNGLDEDGDRELLAAYGGGDLDIHILMRFMSDFREAMWGVVQQVVSELDFDFAATRPSTSSGSSKQRRSPGSAVRSGPSEALVTLCY